MVEELTPKMIETLPGNLPARIVKRLKLASAVDDPHITVNARVFW